MFREMRRNRQQMTMEETTAVLKRGTSGVLCTIGDEGYPYGVPLSYVYEEGKIYFHCAKSGHKLDAIKKDSRVSFCIIDQDQILPEKYTTLYRSVIVFGQAKEMEEGEEKRRAIELLAARFSPSESETNRQKEIEKAYPSLSMIELRIEEMTGKEAIELKN